MRVESPDSAAPEPGLSTLNSQLSTPRPLIRHLIDAIRLPESLFALPFAYLGMLLAAGGLPPWQPVLWVTLAMVGARNAGMALNRVLDRDLDALNPRTADRHLPRGVLRAWHLTALGLFGLALFFFAASQLNPLAFILSPVAGFFVVGYSLCKRFTWLTHFVLGSTLGMAPAGGWIAVTGSFSWKTVLLWGIVATFAAGFDIFNTCPDVEFDRAHGVHSLPARFGLRAGFLAARVLHTLTSLGLLALGIVFALPWPYYVGWTIATALLLYEHQVLKPDDLTRLGPVFLKVNASISIAIFVFTLIAVLMKR